MKKLLLAGLLFAAPLSAQTATDTISLVIRGDMTTVSITVPVTFTDTLQVGDTITFTARAVNSSGNEVSAIINWSAVTVGCATAPCQPALSIDPVTGFAMTLRITAPGERVLITVTATQVSGQVWGWIEGTGQPFQSPPLRPLYAGEQVQLCAYAVNRLDVVGQNPGSPGFLCPAAPPGFTVGTTLPNGSFWTASRPGAVVPWLPTTKTGD